MRSAATRTRALRWSGAVILCFCCSAALSPALAQAAAQGSPARLAQDYRVGPGDKIHISVYDEEGMTGDYLVTDRGDISFPLIGDLQVAGKTVPDIRRAIQTRLSAGLINNPAVTAQILTFRPFYILGEVNKPGEYPYSMGLNIYRAVATAQGFTYRASTHKVMITHAGETAEHKVKVAGTIVMPGDTIRVIEKFF